MIKATRADKDLIIDILSDSFSDNRSVTSLVGEGKGLESRMRHLMSYSFEQSFLRGLAFLNDEKNACVLLIDHSKKLPFLKATGLDLSLVINVVGLKKLSSTLKKQSAIKNVHPKSAYYHLWYIGVKSDVQSKGAGSQLLKEVIDTFGAEHPIYLETSTMKNVPWYEKHGFETIDKIDFGYQLYMMKLEPNAK
ncbi:MAG: GNAT family N-acetyltransferase [Bacteroidota bacterium]